MAQLARSRKSDRSAIVRLGMNLQLARKNCQKTQVEASDAVGVHQNTIARYERGEVEPSVEVVRRMATLYSVPLESLYSELGSIDSERTHDTVLPQVERACGSYRVHMGSGNVLDMTFHGDVPQLTDNDLITLTGLVRRYIEASPTAKSNQS